MPVYIKKYQGSNYFSEREYVDSIELTHIPADGLPIFRFETEDPAGLGTYRAGDFDLNISLLQKERSTGGKDIREFFLGEERDYYYLVILKTGAQSFSGISQQSQIHADYTYTQNRWFVKLTCKDILIEWAKRCEAAANSTINFANGEQLTFEEYMIRHFAGLTSGVVMLGLPQKSYLSRLRELYSNIQWCYALGDYRNFITGQENISRWETFKELAKGLGFNFEMYLNPGSEFTNEPEFVFNIFFLSDLLDEEPLEVEIIEISESITAPRLEWLFLKYRSLVFPEAEYSDGIFFNGDTIYQSDTNHGDGTTLYPTCALTFNGKMLSYVNGNQITEKSLMKDIDYRDFGLKLYGYDFMTGRPIGKLFPLNEAQGGGIAYSRIFNCLRVHGGNGDYYDFISNQETAMINHRRFTRGTSQLYIARLKLKLNTIYKLWNTLRIHNQSYAVFSIRELDYLNNCMVVDLIRL